MADVTRDGGDAPAPRGADIAVAQAPEEVVVECCGAVLRRGGAVLRGRGSGGPRAGAFVLRGGGHGCQDGGPDGRGECEDGDAREPSHAGPLSGWSGWSGERLIASGRVERPEPVEGIAVGGSGTGVASNGSRRMATQCGPRRRRR